MILLGEVNYENLTVIGAAAGLVTWLVRTYAPRVIESHLEFVRAVEHQGERHTVALEKLAELNNIEHVKRTNAALSHGALAVAGFVRGTDRESVVMPHIDAMQKTLSEQ